MQHFNPLSLVAERMENTSIGITIYIQILIPKLILILILILILNNLIGMKDFCVDTWKCSSVLTDFIKQESTNRSINPVHFFTSYHDDIVNTANDNKRRKFEGDGEGSDEKNNTEDK